MQSLQKELLNLIRENYPKEVSIDKLFMLCGMLNHKQSTGERKLRVLTHLGLIIPLKTDKGAIRAYKAIFETNGIFKVPSLKEQCEFMERQQLEFKKEIFKNGYALKGKIKPFVVYKPWTEKNHFNMRMF